MPALSGFQSQFGEKGLHIFSFEQRVAKKYKKGVRQDAVQTAKSKELPYPASFGGASKFSGDDYHPWSYGWLIGIDGKVIWAGNPGRDGFSDGLDIILSNEIAKIKHPGLGKHDIDAAAEKSANEYSAGNFGKARELARALLKSKLAKKDAKYIVARVDNWGKRYGNRAKQLVKEKQYLAAQRMYQRIGKVFEGGDEAKDAGKALAKFEKSKKIQGQIAADVAWEKLEPDLAKNAANRQKQIKDFVTKHKGTQAAKNVTALE